MTKIFQNALSESIRSKWVVRIRGIDYIINCNDEERVNIGAHCERYNRRHHTVKQIMEYNAPTYAAVLLFRGDETAFVTDLEKVIEILEQ